MVKSLENSINLILGKLQTWFELAVQNFPNAVLAIVVLVLSFYVSRWIGRFAAKGLDKTHLSSNISSLLTGVIRIALLAVGTMLALGILKLDKVVLSMLAGVGVVGLALGFAFQDLASNFISGIMIAIRAPIRIGDIVEISGEIGVVKEIRLRDTVIRSFTGQHIYLPNKEFTGKMFKNFSDTGERRITISVGVGYEDDLRAAKKTILKTIKEIKTNSTQEPAVYLTEFGASSMNMVVHLWIKFPGDDYLGLIDEGIIRIKESLDKAGFNIPFPIRTVDLHHETKAVIEAFKSK